MSDAVEPPDVLLVHATDDAALASDVAERLRQRGLDPAYSETVAVGQSTIEYAGHMLAQGVPLALLATRVATGTRQVVRTVNAARQSGVPVYILQVERDANTDAISYGERALPYWRDPNSAIDELAAVLLKRYGQGDPLHRHEVLRRFEELTLRSCDLIDLAKLPATPEVALRDVRLRQLFLPLHLDLSLSESESVPQAIAEIEAARRVHWGDVWIRNPDGSRTKKLPPPRYDHVRVGDALRAASSLVVLGDPGSGKTTLLRWIATTHLLYRWNDPDYELVPQALSLPTPALLPILVRCRDLTNESVDSLSSILARVLEKMEVAAGDSQVLIPALHEEMRAARALLLVDGLDEISHPARVELCHQIERIRGAYPTCPIVVTSRIVGYADLHERIAAGFRHATIAELADSEKDAFIDRWCRTLEQEHNRDEIKRGLIRDVHTDQVESITSNPLLLTTFLLVRRRLGALPERRVDLYAEAVKVMLNWRLEGEDPLSERESIPQLGYVAFAMCQAGTYTLSEERLLALLTQARDEYQQLRAIQRRAPELFLTALMTRTALLVDAGTATINGRHTTMYEFRHRTYQDYMAAIALLEGVHPGALPRSTLADRAGDIVASMDERVAREIWLEPLRLCVSAAHADAANDALRAMVRTANSAGSGKGTAGLVVALICLTDDPDVPQATVDEIVAATISNSRRSQVLASVADSAPESEAATIAAAMLHAEFAHSKASKHEEIWNSYANALTGLSELTIAWYEKREPIVRRGRWPAVITTLLALSRVDAHDEINLGSQNEIALIYHVIVLDLIDLLEAQPVVARASALTLARILALPDVRGVPDEGIAPLRRFLSSSSADPVAQGVIARTWDPDLRLS